MQIAYTKYICIGISTFTSTCVYYLIRNRIMYCLNLSLSLSTTLSVHGLGGWHLGLRSNKHGIHGNYNPHLPSLNIGTKDCTKTPIAHSYVLRGDWLWFG